jgi:hypothetical protein
MSSTGYIAPPDLEGVVQLLADNPKARILAGGHSLLLQANRGGIASSLLVDLKNIHALSGVELEPDGTLKIGAMSTIRTIATDELVRAQYPALAEAALLIGDAQLRNRATLGGSLALADPEADLPALILALEARIVIKGLQNPRTMPAAEFFTGSRQTVLKPGEVITSVLFRAAPERFGWHTKNSRIPPHYTRSAALRPRSHWAGMVRLPPCALPLQEPRTIQCAYNPSKRRLCMSPSMTSLLPVPPRPCLTIWFCVTICSHPLSIAATYYKYSPGALSSAPLHALPLRRNE